METFSLILLVFVLGLRHGLDADHLACIDGLTRYNLRMNSPIARWVGTLFSFGHGFVVASVAVILGVFIKDFKIPVYVDTFVTWISVLSLFSIGTLNVYNLLKTNPESDKNFQVSGIKGKFIPRAAKETTNPFIVILIGGLFAMAADTVSQTSMWAIAAGNSGKYMPIILGIVFMVGMMVTDTIDSFVAFRMVSHSTRLGQSASRIMGWIIVSLAYGVSFYEAFTYFYPRAEVDFEIVGVIIFVSMVICFGLITFKVKRKVNITID
ncbi:sodium:proton antiporter [Neobacillus niacini]|uniref:HoxN/HupN/NixA family nickel/cobalt transporter n=1 Tax=Neobacillus niacini TaxID=86668 RepID=UPI002855B4F0|nr:sodium:proton antiporter [Neobacillus niacini]MDR6999781.1 high-affinity nickel-transport protein [Neobacillus niacini]